MDHPHPDFLVGQLLQGGLHRLRGALDVSFDNHVQGLHLTGLDLTEQILQGDLTHIAVQAALLLRLTLLGQLAGHTFISHGVEIVAGLRHLAHTDNLHRDGGTGLRELLPLGVGHGTDAANGGTGDDDIALVEGAVLHQQRGHRTAALIQPGLNDRAVGGAVGVGLQLLHFGGQIDHLQQVVNALAGLGGDGANNGVAAPLLRHQLVLGELLLDPLGVGSGFIHLVDGHDHRDLGGLGVVDGLHGLGHDAVVGGHHQDGHVSNHGTAGTHGGKGLVAGGVQEGNRLALHLHLIGTDVLGNAAGLTGRHVGVADIVQQRGLAVVDVAHDHHNGSAGDQILLFILGGVDELLLDGDDHFLLHLAAQLHGHQGGGIVVDDLAEGGHDAHLHQGLDHLGAGLLHAAGQLAHADLIGDEHLDGGLLGDLQLQAAQTVLLLLLALVAGALLTAALTLGVAVLELLLAAPVLLALVGEGLQPLVVLIQVHRAAAAGVHHLLGGDAAGGLGHGLLSLLTLVVSRLGLLGLLGTGLLAALAALLLGRTLDALALLSRLALIGLGRLRLGGGGLMVHIRIDGLNGVHLVVLGQIFKDQGQLLVGQGLHMVLGRMSVLGQDVHDLLGLKLLGTLLKILGHLVDGIFDHHIREPPRFLGIMPELSGQLAAAWAGSMLQARARASGPGRTCFRRAGGLPLTLVLPTGGGGLFRGRIGYRPGFLFAVLQVFLVLAFLLLPLENPVRLLPQLLGSRAIALRIPGGKLLGH